MYKADQMNNSKLSPMYVENGVLISKWTYPLLAPNPGQYLPEKIHWVDQYWCRSTKLIHIYRMTTTVASYDTIFTWVYNITNSQCIEFLS